MLTFFEANERYQNANKLGKLSKSKQPSAEKHQDKQEFNKSSILAAKVNVESSNPFTSCTLCSDKANGDHPIHKCPNFTTAKEKIARLSILNGCTKCARIKHLDSSCHFRFDRKCKHCQGWNFSFLCLSDNHESSVKVRDLVHNTKKAVPNPKQNEKGKSKDAQNSTQNGVVCPGSSFQSNGGIDSILPTFSYTLGPSKIRGLKDSGSQANYISECALEGQCFKIVKDNFDLIVNGFNGAKCYRTRIVQIAVKIGETVHNVEAICVPGIDINLNLPGLGKIVKCFRNSGYKLLDEFLDEDREDISNIQFILGANSAHCLMERMVSFGHSSQSVYYETKFGIMLIGNIEKLILNLKFLPSLHDNTHLLCFGLEENLDEQGKSLDNIKFPMTSCFKSSVRCIGSAEDPAICILDHDGRINEHKLQKATDHILERECSYYLHKDSTDLDGESIEHNKKLVRYLLNNTQRIEEGRLVMPLLWNGLVSHLLGENTNLAKQILKSNLKKLSKNDDFFKLMDENVKTQAAQNLIERIDNLDRFCEEHPEYSFLPHIGIFKLDRSTTKCRMVFLSNLCEKH